ncbi:hypothetical protein SAMN06265171_106309 [Chryseobacterium rhizoplanae]|uniref:Lipoprotein n=1 Tax=Chryseobacterium rhizoplanae TaxID=1609531 RepID=A0A521E272_9FLAO|nr:hypothetical protein [Chryseobacterium rhizoplanae]SMO78048.1 hypothetical protein SAMN06265171_106309 [Chryseobacterium rhizoplanae]
MEKIIFVVICLLFLTSCKKEKAIELQDFNFNNKTSTYFSDKDKYKTYDNYYQIKSEVIGVDTIFDGEFIGSEKPIRIEYRQEIFSHQDVLARFDDFDFNAINFATTLNGKMMVFNAVAGDISLKETKKFVEFLDQKYGKSKVSKETFIKPYDIYTWRLKDRMIKYCVVADDGSNTMNIEVKQANKGIDNRKNKSDVRAFLYIIKNEYADQVIGKMSSGDLLYCR